MGIQRQAIVEVMKGCVHLLVDIDPPLGIHQLVKPMKGRSSRLLRPKRREPLEAPGFSRGERSP
jgi:REP element-mobilizing transposase RayT